MTGNVFFFQERCSYTYTSY